MHRNQKNTRTRGKQTITYSLPHFLSIHILSWHKGYKKSKQRKDRKDYDQKKDDQERKDNSALVVELYNQYSCIPVANFFTINLPSERTEEVRA